MDKKTSLVSIFPHSATSGPSMLNYKTWWLKKQTKFTHSL